MYLNEIDMITLIYIIGVIINAYMLRESKINKESEVYAFTFVILWSWVLVLIGLFSKIYWWVILKFKW